MAGYATGVATQFLLKGLTGQALGFSLPRTVYLGLAITVPEDSDPTLSNINEVTTSGYARLAVTWGSPTTTLPISITNSAQVTIGPVTADMLQAAGFAFLSTVVSGTAGDLLYVWELAQPVSALNGKSILVPANQLIIE